MVRERIPSISPEEINEQILVVIRKDLVCK